jgi:hypothetical protein
MKIRDEIAKIAGAAERSSAALSRSAKARAVDLLRFIFVPRAGAAKLTDGGFRLDPPQRIACEEGEDKLGHLPNRDPGNPRGHADAAKAVTVALACEKRLLVVGINSRIHP